MPGPRKWQVAVKVTGGRIGLRAPKNLESQRKQHFHCLVVTLIEIPDPGPTCPTCHTTTGWRSLEFTSHTSSNRRRNPEISDLPFSSQGRPEVEQSLVKLLFFFIMWLWGHPVGRWSVYLSAMRPISASVRCSGHGAERETKGHGAEQL